MTGLDNHFSFLGLQVQELAGQLLDQESIRTERTTSSRVDTSGSR